MPPLGRYSTIVEVVKETESFLAGILRRPEGLLAFGRDSHRRGALNVKLLGEVMPGTVGR